MWNNKLFCIYVNAIKKEFCLKTSFSINFVRQMAVSVFLSKQKLLFSSYNSYSIFLCVEISEIGDLIGWLKKNGHTKWMRTVFGANWMPTMKNKLPGWQGDRRRSWTRQTPDRTAFVGHFEGWNRSRMKYLDLLRGRSSVTATPVYRETSEKTHFPISIIEKPLFC